MADREGTIDHIRYDVDGHVAVITLDRPDRLNAFTMAMERRLDAAIGEADADSEVRCIVVTGAGRGFCAGDDIQDQWNDPEMTESLGDSAERGAMTPLFETMLAVRTPTVAAVNGAAVGIGMDLALFCDVRFVAPTARLGQGYISMGLVPDIGGTWLLPQLVGPMEAARMVLTGGLIDATEAVRIGLALDGGDDVVATATDFARRVAERPPLAVTATIDLLRAGAGLAVEQLGPLAAERARVLAALFETDDHHEAIAAFTEKRAGEFHGR